MIRLCVALLTPLLIISQAVAKDSKDTDQQCHVVTQGIMTQNLQDYLFKAVSLNEHQKMQIRDIMSRLRPDYADPDPEDIIKMRDMITAEHFDGEKAKEFMTQRFQKQLNQQLETMHVLNMMYKLLDKKQKAKLDHCFSYEVAAMQQLNRAVRDFH